MVEKSYDVTVMEQLWWNRNGGRVYSGEKYRWNSSGGTVMVQLKWWNCNG